MPSREKRLSFLKSAPATAFFWRKTRKKVIFAVEIRPKMTDAIRTTINNFPLGDVFTPSIFLVEISKQASVNRILTLKNEEVYDALQR